MNTIHRLISAALLALVAPFLLVVPAHATGGSAEPCPGGAEVCAPPAEPCPGGAEVCIVDPCVEGATVDYRPQVVALTAELEEQEAQTARAEARVARQAATIERLRAKLAAARG